jgi:hypothetical protein
VEVTHMQKVFNSNQKPCDYKVGAEGTGEYPDASQKYPFKDCGMPIPLKNMDIITDV